MPIFAGQFRTMVRNTLQAFTPIPYTMKAETLLLMTAAHESVNGTYLRQRVASGADGVARGVYQMEPDTLEDHYAWMRVKRPDMLTAVEGLRAPSMPPVSSVMYNLAFATAMARIHYFRRPDVIPEDLDGQAALAKKVFNTAAGAATWQDYRQAYRKFYGE